MKFIFLLSFLGLVFSRTELSEGLENLKNRLLTHYNAYFSSLDLCTQYLRDQCSLYGGVGEYFGFSCKDPEDACKRLIESTRDSCQELKSYLSSSTHASLKFSSEERGIHEVCRFFGRLCDLLPQNCPDSTDELESLCDILRKFCSEFDEEEYSLYNLLIGLGSDVYDSEKCKKYVHNECKKLLLYPFGASGDRDSESDTDPLKRLCGSNGDLENGRICDRLRGQVSYICEAFTHRYLGDEITLPGKFNTLRQLLEKYKTLSSEDDTNRGLLRELAQGVHLTFDHLKFTCKMGEPCVFASLCSGLQTICDQYTQHCNKLDELEAQLPSVDS